MTLDLPENADSTVVDIDGSETLRQDAQGDAQQCSCNGLVRHHQMQGAVRRQNLCNPRNYHHHHLCAATYILWQVWPCKPALLNRQQM